MKGQSEIGNRYVRLVVVQCLGPAKDRSLQYLCRCDCGNETVGKGVRLRSGRKRSCGCLMKEVNAEKCRRQRTIHGEARHNNGLKQSDEYQTWAGIKYRCSSDRHIGYLTYKGAGVTMDPRWAGSFEEFLKDMGRKPSPEHSIDRIDRFGPYAPWNCRWATRKEQQRNMRSNHWREINGEAHIIAEWVEILGIPRWKICKMGRRVYR